MVLRVRCRLTTACNSDLKLRLSIVNENGSVTHRIDEFPVGIGGVGMKSLATAAFTKPTGQWQIRLSGSQGAAGADAVMTDIAYSIEIEDPGVTKLWNLWVPSNQGALLDVPPEHISVGLKGYAFFDFAQIPLGATVTVNYAGQGIDADVSYRLRVCDPINYTDATGDIILNSTWLGSFGGDGIPFSATASFINIYTGVKFIKITGFRTAAVASNTGRANNQSLTLRY